MEAEVRDRRMDEVEALQAVYGDDLRSSLVGDVVTAETPREDFPLEGPWFIRISNGENGDADSGLGAPVLEIRLPSRYPLGDERPEPILHNIMMKPKVRDEFLKELADMYETEMDVGILWGERCREELLSGGLIEVSESEGNILDENTDTLSSEAQSDDGNCSSHDHGAGGGVSTFIPPTTRYSQPIRHFPTEVISDKQYERTITHTPPFHPPKSGPAENMIAHVCTVECMEHVQWALAELLFNDKKVAKATHNMFAYRFTNDDGSQVADNDDDGEKGSGSKLASLLQMCEVDNVLVVVSRWYGGCLLGPARFKWIASVARDGLVQGGYLES